MKLAKLFSQVIKISYRSCMVCFACFKPRCLSTKWWAHDVKIAWFNFFTYITERKKHNEHKKQCVVHMLGWDVLTIIHNYCHWYSSCLNLTNTFKTFPRVRYTILLVWVVPHTSHVIQTTCDVGKGEGLIDITNSCDQIFTQVHKHLENGFMYHTSVVQIA